MEEDEDGASSGAPSLPKPMLKINSSLQPNLIICSICNASSDKKHAKRKGITPIVKRENFKANAVLWESYEHVYSSVFQKVDWNAETLHGCKDCKALFSNANHREKQPKKQIKSDGTVDGHEHIEHAAPQNDIPDAEQNTQKRNSGRGIYKYKTSKDNPVCIICLREQYDKKHHKIPVITISNRREGEKLHEAEKKLLEYAHIHEVSGSRYHSAGQRILLQNSIRSLFLQDVAYHRQPCYKNFTTNTWKRSIAPKDDPASDESVILTEFLDLVELNVIVKRDVYTVAQLRKCLYDLNGSSSRSTDIKNILTTRFGNEIKIGKPEGSSKVCSEYVYSSRTDFTPGLIQSAITGNGIETSIMVKNLASRIGHNIKARPQSDWPPTPQQIIESNDDVNMDLYNFLALLVSPGSSIDNTGTVRLSESKTKKVVKLCEDIESLVPTRKPSLSQVLLSLTMHRKTASSDVVDTIHDHGHGISYTETVFIEDKWAEWVTQQSKLLPPFIKKNKETTHILDNIDWKNMSISGIETHHTNSIVVQEGHHSEGDLSSVLVELDYNFDRSEHRSFKGTECNIPNIRFKRGTAKILNFESENFANIGRHEYERSSLKTLLWLFSRLNACSPADQNIPGLSGFHELCGQKSFPVRVGYLPAIRAPPTEMRVIYAGLNRSMDIMDELDLKYIYMEIDQAIYHKVLDAMFKMENEGVPIFQKVIPRMGGFHIGLCMIRTIYSQFKNSGIVEVLSSAGLGGEGTIQKYLKGGDTKQAIYLYKLLYEALMRYKIEHFKRTDPGCLPAPIILEEVVDTVVDDMIERGYIKTLPKLEGPMAQWMDCLLEMITILLNMLHFQRSGNWLGVLETIHEFLPYCFRLNRKNYARNLSYYYCHMLQLQYTNHEAYNHLLQGGFTGSLTGKAHSRIPMDQIMETTINRWSKEVGGISGKTENEGATERWIRINHFMSALKEHQRKKTRKKKIQHHEDLGNKKKERDEKNVRCVLTCIRSWAPDLWSDNQPISHLANGEIATEAMVKEFKDARKKGEDARDEFIQRFTQVCDIKRSNIKSY